MTERDLLSGLQQVPAITVAYAFVQEFQTDGADMHPSTTGAGVERSSFDV